jgi:hypothetical protein
MSKVMYFIDKNVYNYVCIGYCIDDYLKDYIINNNFQLFKKLLYNIKIESVSFEDFYLLNTFNFIYNLIEIALKYNKIKFLKLIINFIKQKIPTTYGHLFHQKALSYCIENNIDFNCMDVILDAFNPLYDSYISTLIYNINNLVNIPTYKQMYHIIQFYEKINKRKFIYNYNNNYNYKINNY